MRTVPSKTAVVRALVAGAVAVTGVVAGASPASAAYPPTIVPCHLDQTVGELTQWGANGKNNVIVYVGSAKKSAHFEGVVKRGHKKKYGCNEIGEPFNNKRTFYWVVFHGKGTFVRKGDGGYRNWAFFGVYDRVNDKKVKFHARG
ncbi:hypothetical protein [Mangrovihabitans endophyticus]|uniref:Uncharacterized protein n=1 Tax=Mangrovihabitans endophyticus TaxID=1751298 RepID=A0A8J3BVS6_9ACTN|nr:hypothetical protein [Mangrovihabitans endophyticus]GGK81814.1 hypothetical protein GCM10012284_14840 [Mangrovihabitans endophyticus]